MDLYESIVMTSKGPCSSSAFGYKGYDNTTISKALEITSNCVNFKIKIIRVPMI